MTTTNREQGLAKALVWSAGVTIAYMLLCGATNPPAMPFMWIWLGLSILTCLLAAAFFIAITVRALRTDKQP